MTANVGKRLACGALIRSLAIVGCTTARNSFDQQALPILGGQPSSCYPQTVFLESLSGTCTGVVIAPDLVLTAGHCVMLEGVPALGMSVTGAGGGAVVVERYVHPGYQTCRPAGTTFAATSGRDVAVLRVSGSLLPPGIPAAALAGASPGARAEVGQTVAAVGYGAPTNTRMEASFAITSIAPDGSLTVGNPTAATCSGDSGGGFYRAPAACSGSPPPVIVGITSSQPLGFEAGVCAAGQATVVTNVTDPINAQFIADVLTGRATPSDMTAVSCCIPGSMRTCSGGQETCREDGTWGACVAGGCPSGTIACGESCCDPIAAECVQNTCVARCTPGLETRCGNDSSCCPMDGLHYCAGSLCVESQPDPWPSDHCSDFYCCKGDNRCDECVDLGGFWQTRCEIGGGLEVCCSR
jgi:hypothetical protein